MFKLLTLLAAGMFLTLLIGGKDEGQMRQGLAGLEEPAKRPVVRKAAATAETKPEVTLATFSPAAVPPPPAKVVSVSAPVVGGFVVMEADKPVAVAAAAEVDAVVEDAPEMPVLYVSGRSVNVRGGPSTDYEIVGRLTRAEAVSVVSPEVNGWVQIRIEGDGIDGYIAARLLTDTDPAG